MNIFKEFREQNHLSQAQAAKGVGVTRNCWSMWEHGKRRPSPEKAENLVNFAESLNFTINYRAIYKRSIQIS